MSDEALRLTRDRLLQAKSLLVLTGAGISVASGLRTYRGAEESLYADPARLRLAFGSSLRRDPGAFWREWRPRRRELRAARPNPGHAALVVLEARLPRFLLATQNVDDLHRRAGSRAPVELHGNALLERCLAECPGPPWPAPEASDVDDAPAPTCPRCGGPARPDVVLFGEGADARWEPVRDFARAGVDLVLLVGTSGTVAVPEELLRLVRAAGPTWVVDLNLTPAVAGADAALAGRAGGLRPALLLP